MCVCVCMYVCLCVIECFCMLVCLDIGSPLHQCFVLFVALLAPFLLLFFEETVRDG